VEYYENSVDATAVLSWATPFSSFASATMLSMKPGSAQTFKLGVKNYTPETADIDWSASSASPELEVMPQTGTLTVKAGGKSTADVTVKAPEGTPEGIYSVPIQINTGSSDLPPVSVKVAVGQPGSLAPFYNNKGVSSDANPGEANFDLVGWSYSAEALEAAGITPGSNIQHDGITFTWPKQAPGEQNNVICRGQQILLDQSGTRLGLIGSAASGPSQGTGTIHYADGTDQQFQLGFSDWTLQGGGASDPSFGNDVIASMPYRNSQTDQQNVDTYIFYTSVSLEEGKTVESITLPDANSIDQGDIHIFDIDVK
jgi:hypothetical protein